MPGGAPRKLPAREEVVRLYQEGASTPEIARMFGVTDPKTVRVQLLRAGLKLRRHTVTKTCRECELPAVKMVHPLNGCEYGTRCAKHRRIHCQRLNRNLRRVKNGIAPEKYKPWQIHELKPEGWQWITQSKKQLRAIRSLLASPSALGSLREESKQGATSLD